MTATLGEPRRARPLFLSRRQGVLPAPGGAAAVCAEIAGAGMNSLRVGLLIGISWGVCWGSDGRAQRGRISFFAYRNRPTRFPVSSPASSRGEDRDLQRIKSKREARGAAGKAPDPSGAVDPGSAPGLKPGIGPGTELAHSHDITRPP